MNKEYDKWWNARVDNVSGIACGEPLIKGSRLCILMVGGRAIRGDAERQELKQDYPFLTDQDLDFCIEYWSRQTTTIKKVDETNE